MNLLFKKTVFALALLAAAGAHSQTLRLTQAFQQALRSVALILLPLSFIALFAWSTAGSATGNTSDPIRAAIWMWLGSHLVPFKLSLASGFSSGAISYLPICAALFPWLEIRSGFRRSS